ncbi:MAG: signal transduction histidine kinase [Acidimicrobiales bacterium]
MVLAIGDERLQLFLTGDSTEATKVTDTLLAELQQTQDPDLGTALASASQNITQARRSGQATALALYSGTTRSLLDATKPGADLYPSAATGNEAIVNRQAIEALETRETAWFAYLAVASEVAASNEAEAVGGSEVDLPLGVLSVAFAKSDLSLTTTVAIATATSRAELDRTLQSGASRNLRDLEIVAMDDLEEGNVVILSSEIVPALVTFRAEWSNTVTEQGANLENGLANDLKQATDLRRLFILLASAGVVAGIGLILMIYRSIANPLGALLVDAHHVANVDFPDLVNRLRDTDDVSELPASQPIVTSSNREIGELAEVFNHLQVTAYGLATEQILDRRALVEMSTNLGRRNQQLLKQTLAGLTELQREEQDPDTLQSLFELDNTITRMRRNAESLLVIAGADTPRKWTEPIDIEDAVRAAFGEVESYERINIAALADAKLQGNAVADVAHLLAELLENALKFSGEDAPVLVSGQYESDHYLLTVFDQGIGMSEDELLEINLRLKDPLAPDQVPTGNLGLFVVSRLADRHDIKVRLVEAPGRGVMARIELPSTMTTPDVASTVEEVEDGRPLGAPHDLDSELAALTEAKGEQENNPSDAASFGAQMDEDHAEADIDRPGNTNLVDEVEPNEQPVPAPPASEVENVPDPSTVQVSDLRQRFEQQSTAQATENSASEASESHGLAEPAPPVLPTRWAGATLADVKPVANPALTDPAESSSPSGAGDFSSMMSALSSGISRGLQDSERPTTDEGIQDQ